MVESLSEAVAVKPQLVLKVPLRGDEQVQSCALDVPNASLPAASRRLRGAPPQAGTTPY